MNFFVPKTLLYNTLYTNGYFELSYGEWSANDCLTSTTLIDCTSYYSYNKYFILSSYPCVHFYNCNNNNHRTTDPVHRVTIATFGLVRFNLHQNIENILKLIFLPKI